MSTIRLLAIAGCEAPLPLGARRRALTSDRAIHRLDRALRESPFVFSVRDAITFNIAAT